MGEVRGPEDVIHRERKPSPDLTPHPIPRPNTLDTLEEVRREVMLLRKELVKIKRVLRTHGITIK